MTKRREGEPDEEERIKGGTATADNMEVVAERRAELVLKKHEKRNSKEGKMGIDAAFKTREIKNKTENQTKRS